MRISYEIGPRSAAALAQWIRDKIDQDPTSAPIEADTLLVELETLARRVWAHDTTR